MNNKAPSSGNGRKILLIILILILVALIFAVIFYKPAQTKVIYHSDLIEGVKKGEIAGIIFTADYQANILFYEKDEAGNVIRGEDGKPVLSDAFKEKEKKFFAGKYADAVVVSTNRTAVTNFIDNWYATGNLDESNYPTILLNDPNSGSFFTKMLPYLSFALMIILVVVMFFMMRGKGGDSVMNFGKSNAKSTSDVKVRFADVAGAEEEKEELQEIVEFLKNPKKFGALGAKIPKGVLLVGPPGTGKTLFARAVAGEAKVPFFSISGSDFVEMYVGVGASRVRSLFQNAKKNMPCIVFIDEIDAVGRHRGAGIGGGNDEREQTLNQLLVQMDGFEANDGVIIMAATNRADVLDPALLRPGRFDRQIYVNMPDVKGREAIFKVHSRNKPISPDVDFRNLARLTTGFSGADISNLLNEAAILAARNNRQVILMQDILEGINKVIAGPQKKSRVITESDKRITAYHEAGHAIVGWCMKHCDAVQEVSIIPRGQAAGYTLSRPKSDDSHVTKNRLNDMLAMMLGGRIAEELVIHDISTGASNDIQRATAIARQMVTEWGMSEKMSTVYYGANQEVFIGRDYQTQTTYSDKIAAEIDKEIQRFIDENYARAKAVLSEKRGVMDNMVRVLYEKDTIYGDEVDMLMEGKSAKEVIDYIDQKAEEQKKKGNPEPPTPPVIAPILPPARSIIVKENQPGSTFPTELKPMPDGSSDNGEGEIATEKDGTAAIPLTGSVADTENADKKETDASEQNPKAEKTTDEPSEQKKDETPEQ